MGDQEARFELELPGSGNSNADARLPMHILDKCLIEVGGRPTATCRHGRGGYAQLGDE